MARGVQYLSIDVRTKFIVLTLRKLRGCNNPLIRRVTKIRCLRGLMITSGRRLIAIILYRSRVTISFGKVKEIVKVKAIQSGGL